MLEGRDEVVQRRAPAWVACMWGHFVFLDPEMNVWVWDDTEEPVGMPPCPRKCPECDEMPTYCGECDDFHDACAGHVYGMKSFCCGHGGRCEPIAMPSDTVADQQTDADGNAMAAAA